MTLKVSLKKSPKRSLQVWQECARESAEENCGDGVLQALLSCLCHQAGGQAPFGFKNKKIKTGTGLFISPNLGLVNIKVHGMQVLFICKLWHLESIVDGDFWC